MRNTATFATRAGLALALSFGALAPSDAAFSNLGNYTLVQHTPDLGGGLLDFSGIAYRDDIGKLYVISNNATAIHRYTTAGAFEGTITLSGFTDTEGIAYMGGDTFAVIEEGVKAITRITIGSSVVSGTITKASGVTMNPSIAGTFANSGFEDLAYDSTANKFYVVKEKDTTSGGTVVKGLYQVDNLAGGGTATTSQLAAATTAISPLATDLAGLYFNNLPGGHLYVQSHESKNIMRVTTSGALVSTLKLPAAVVQIEGLTFSLDGNHLFLIGEPREYLHYQLLDAASAAAASGANNLSAFVAGNKRTFLKTDATTGNYAGLYAKTAAGGNVLGTVATITQGKNATGADETIAMNFRDRAAIEKSPTATNPPITGSLISDVVELTGMLKSGGATSGLGDRKQTDPFALELTYSAAQLTGDEATLAANGILRPMWLDTEFNGAAGAQANDLWKDAVAGNFGTGTALIDQLMSWSAFATANGITDANVGNFLGSWGVDTASDTVWAVLNHNSQFAVVPEPATGGLLVLGTALLGLRRRRH